MGRDMIQSLDARKILQSAASQEREESTAELHRMGRGQLARQLMRSDDEGEAHDKHKSFTVKPFDLPPLAVAGCKTERSGL